jgi:TRAP-type uncharacterized transport system substrate-binding protein
MRRRIFLSSLLAFVQLDGAADGAAGAATPPPTIGIMGGEIDGTFMRIATDLTSVVNSDRIRVLPIVGKGSLQNIDDLLRVPGVDLALVAADAMAYAGAPGRPKSDLGKIQYICKLYENDFHVLARPEIRSLIELQGKPVNIDVDGAGTNLTARSVFRSINVFPDFRTEEPGIGQHKLQQGQIAANVYCAGRPIRLFSSAPAGTDLHFLNVPSNEALEQLYVPGTQLTHADYPSLIPDGQIVETIGVGVVLAVFGWPATSPRYKNLSIFVDTFFKNFSELLKPPHHPKWRDVNIAAAVQWLTLHSQKSAPPPSSDSLAETRLDRFLKEKGILPLSASQREAMQEFLKDRGAHR